MKVKVKMPGDYARHIITEPSKGDILSRPMFDIEPYSDDEVLINDLVTKLPYGPDFYNYIMKILPREAARRNEGLIFKGEVGEKRPNRKIDLPDTYFGHPVYDYYGSDNGDPDRFVWLGEGSARKPKNVPGFYTSIYHGWQDPEYRKYAESADKKSQLLSNILNISHDFSPLLGPITPYKDPDYPWVEYPEGDVKVKNEDYNRKLRSMINSLEHELKYPSKKGGRNKEDILAEIASLKENIDKGFAPAPGHERIPVKMRDVKTGEERKFFISIPHILNMPLYNWNSRLFDFNADNLERIWKMFESADTKNDWGMWDKANQIANYAGEIDESYNTNSPYNYVIENGKLADKGYFSDYLAPRNRAPINTTGKETVKSVEVNPETGKKVVKVNVKQTFEDEGIEDENKKWGLVGRELKRRQGIIDRNFAKEDTGNDTIGNILKGVGEFGQI